MNIYMEYHLVLQNIKLKEITIFNKLISKMLSINPEIRPSSEQILNEINKCIPKEDPYIFFLGDSKSILDILLPPQFQTFKLYQ